MSHTAERTLVVASYAPQTNAEARAASTEGLPEGAAVEVRLDALVEEADLAAIRGAFPGRALLATLRSAAEGGGFRGSVEDARRRLLAAFEAGFDLVDLEHSGPFRDGLPGIPAERVVLSFHDPLGVPADLDGLLDAMRRTGARYLKIVGTARDSRDAMRLLGFQRRRADGRLAAFAMGENGLATRVLAPYLGASLTFGSLVPGRETAPAQIPARDLADVYGIGRLRPAERVCALFGGFVSHSLSPAIHNANFEAGGDPILYVPFALRSLLMEFDPLVVALDGLGLPLAGASVTIPFKEEAATVAVFRREGVANTLLRSGDAFTAKNTDSDALAQLIPRAAEGDRALLLGAGGTARAAADVLAGHGYRVSVWNRDPSRARDLADETGAEVVDRFGPKTARFQLLVNATPVGMKPGDGLPCPEALLHPNLLVVDAPYRPGGTPLVLAARSAGARVVDGYAFLLCQAAGQAELFTGRPVTMAELAARLPVRFRTLFDEEWTADESLPAGVGL